MWIKFTLKLYFKIFCGYTKCFIYCNLTNNVFCVLHIKSIISHMPFCLNKKLYLIKLITCSRTFFKTVKFFELGENCILIEYYHINF